MGSKLKGKRRSTASRLKQSKTLQEKKLARLRTMEHAGRAAGPLLAYKLRVAHAHKQVVKALERLIRAATKGAF